MSYVNKKTRIFLDRGDIQPERRRSEARLKTYPSATDIRAWCDYIEDRRQHILELVTKGKEKCTSKLVPIEALINAILANKNADICKLKKCLVKLWDFIASISLNEKDREKLCEMREKMDKICVESNKTFPPGKFGTFGGKCHEKCPARARHEKERSEVVALVKSTADDVVGSYKVTAKGPSKVTTRIKGMQPGVQLSSGQPTGRITTRAQGSKIVKTTIKSVYPSGQIKSGGPGVTSQSSAPDQTTNDTCTDNNIRSGEKTDPYPDTMVSQLAHSTMIEGIACATPPCIPAKQNMDASNTIQDQVMARDMLCNELQNNIDNLKDERDQLKSKLEVCEQELEKIKKLNVVNPLFESSCKEEIEALELEIKVMRSGNLSPEQEAEVIKKEVEMLRKYCVQMKTIEYENEQLRCERDKVKNGTILDFTENSPKIEELMCKLKNLDEITKERDSLANKVQKLEKELLQYRDLPEDIEVYRDRSKMLDNALEERDKMSKQIEQMKDMQNEVDQLRRKSSRVDELEQQLKKYDRNDKNTDIELKKTKSKCSCLEKELENAKKEKDSMCNRIECMKREIDSLRSKAKEAEIFRLERDRLQIKLNELSHIQVQNENLMVKCRCLENAATERDTFKHKYEEILNMECQCEMLRSQVDTAKHLSRERDALVKQVGDLECCICDQEEEIKKLVLQIDCLTRNKDDTQCRMKDALANMRAEVEKKDCLIAASEEKLTAVQAQLKSSIQGVSCETLCYKTRIEDLERELSRSQAQVDCLRRQLKEKDNYFMGAKKSTKNECELVCKMKRELEVAKGENKRLQEIANKMVALTGDEHVQKMLKQSECAVKRVVEELGRQYKEWDSIQQRQQKGKFAQISKECPYKIKRMEIHDLSDSESNDRLREELEDIQKEKLKLEKLVRQIQENKFAEGTEKEVVSLKIENINLQEQLEKEIKNRKMLEKKLLA